MILSIYVGENWKQYNTHSLMIKMLHKLETVENILKMLKWIYQNFIPMDKNDTPNITLNGEK